MSEETGSTSVAAAALSSTAADTTKTAEEEKQAAASEAPVSQKEPQAVPFTGFKGIFSLKSKNQSAKERFSQKPQDYLESHKMSIYLQDAIKIILDRREEKPLELLNE